MTCHIPPYKQFHPAYKYLHLFVYLHSFNRTFNITYFIHGGCKPDESPFICIFIYILLHIRKFFNQRLQDQIHFSSLRNNKIGFFSCEQTEYINHHIGVRIKKCVYQKVTLLWVADISCNFATICQSDKYNLKRERKKSICILQEFRWTTLFAAIFSLNEDDSALVSGSTVHIFVCA